MGNKVKYQEGCFSWADLIAHDPQQQGQFYEQLFGWKTVEQDTQGGPPYSIFQLANDEITGMGEMPAEMKSQGIPPMWNCYISVEDVNSITEKATSLGGKITMPVMQVLDAGTMAYISDPSGANVGLWQPGNHTGADVTNAPGSMCWSELLTRDLNAAQSFFSELFGWSYHKHEHSPMDYYYIMHGETPIGGMMTMDEQMEDIPPHWGVYFSVSDIETATQNVTELKGSVMTQPFDIPTVGRMSVVADSHGASFSMIQMAAEADS